MIAPSRHPVRAPFAGGLEAMVWHLAAGLTERGHEVHLSAPAGTDPAIAAYLYPHPAAELTPSSHGDAEFTGPHEYADHHAMMSAITSLVAARVEVISDHSLHFYPLVLAGALPAPLIKTLHTPPFPSLESAVRLAPPEARLVAVSHAAAELWRGTGREVEVILNGVDERIYRPGGGGSGAVWAGRLTPEKDPVAAITAAQAAGVTLNLAGQMADPGYFRSEVLPLLGERARYLGHLDQTQLATLYGRSGVLVMTSRWSEPFGLVAAEALMCGTPVATLDRGGLAEVVCDGVSGKVCSTPDELPAAIAECLRLPRELVAKDARERLTSCRMIDEYEAVLTRAC